MQSTRVTGIKIPGFRNYLKVHITSPLTLETKKGKLRNLLQLVRIS